MHQGQSIKEFEKKYKRPTEIEFIKDIFSTFEEQEDSILRIRQVPGISPIKC